MQTVNLQIAPIGIKPVINLSQYDVGRTFKLVLYDGASAYSMPAGTMARIDGLKPDKTAFSYSDAVSVSGNQATITVKDQMTVLQGDVECELRFIKDDDNIGTLNFTLRIEKSPIDADTPISDTEIPAIISLAQQQEANAEAWAVGTKYGEPVTASDPQYENNSKYYAEQAESSAENAYLSEQDALTYKNNAANSAILSESWAVGGTKTRSG